MGIVGSLPSQIGNLSNLEVLDLSYNGNLTGTLPTQLFLLTNLSKLYLQNCGFLGTIPEDLGNLTNLTYLVVNNNFFAGPIPASIGQLSQLIWVDISSNQLTGNLPKSLTNLTKAQHFHFQANNFSGIIPAGIFNSNMSLIHLLLHNNSFNGPIPADVGNLTQLDILRLDFNSFSGIPGTLMNLATVSAVQLDHNGFTSDVPDFTNLTNLQIVDLGHNQFIPGPVPSWFSKLPSLSSLAMEAGNLEGEVPSDIFSALNLTTVMLGSNSLNGTLDLRKAGSSLTEVDFQLNNISGLIGSFSGTLNLQGNPICQTNPNQPDNACSPTPTSYSSIPTSSCSCPQGLVSNPTAASGSCLCAYPISGVLIFTALKVTLNSKVVPTLQSGFAKNIRLITNEDQVSISIISDFVANISIFPNNGKVWDINQANLITALISSKAILFPTVGPYEYLPFGPYSPPGNTKSPGLSGNAKVGVGVGVAALVVIILSIGIYAFRQKKRADKAEQISKPFVSWMASGEDKGDAPKLKGARLFTLAEMKKATDNFSKSNEIGVGGYGKVYKGVLNTGEEVAIKRAQASSQQGATEFKNEIELLSRVHHKNLVGLVGFCFEEQMLIYEYMPNGTLHGSLSGHSGVRMDWQRRLALALGSARGLAYLHTEANPPIIHRDVKSSNILLDEKLVAKVADFGLSKLAPDGEGTGKDHVSTQVKGTLGYLDPEYYTSQRLTDKSDVYSFGVVLLELITARQPIEHGKFIVREVRTALQKDGLQQLLDPELTDCPTADLKVFLDLALRCVEEESSNRPTMKTVAKNLESLMSDAESATGKKSGYNFAEHGKQEPEFGHDVDSRFHYSGGYGLPVTIEPK